MTTPETQQPHLTPQILLGAADHQQLMELATAGLDRHPEVAEELLSELDRASVISDDEVPQDVVRMGSRVRYRADGSAEREVTLVYPADANIDEGKISVMTPVGTALIGLRSGQSIDWLTRDGRQQVLTVLDVTQRA
ncbi:MAG TPA: nucleoside diphosphate kinase regulator [Devosiaceae bacterium]|nr:nucleoside diphosphate kinase regulator [Devosiaceae bacterium]